MTKKKSRLHMTSKQFGIASIPPQPDHRQYGNKRQRRDQRAHGGIAAGDDRDDSHNHARNYRPDRKFTHIST